MLDIQLDWRRVYQFIIQFTTIQSIHLLKLTHWTERLLLKENWNKSSFQNN